MIFSKTLCAITVFSALATTASAAPIQWSVASGGNGHWYDAFNEPLAALDAFADAATRTHLGLDGYVATITSAAEQAFITANLNPNAEQLWLGGSDRDNEGIWNWVNGPETGQLIAGSYENWASGEPNDFSIGEDYMVGWWAGDAWNDLPGSSSRGYLIEYSGDTAVVPLPAGLGLLASGLFGLGVIGRRRKRA